MPTKAKRTTIRDVLHTAMSLEKQAMELYTAFVSHHLEKPELHRFWLTMARHEAGHYGALALVESMIRQDPELEVGAKVWFDEATVVRLKSLLQAYQREARETVPVERALEMAIDIESSELEDVVVDLMQLVQDTEWRNQATKFLIHDLSDLSTMVEKYTRSPKLLRRAEALLGRRIDAVRAKNGRNRPKKQERKDERPSRGTRNQKKD